MDLRQSDSVTEHASFHRSPPSLPASLPLLMSWLALQLLGHSSNMNLFFFCFFFNVYRAKVITQDVAAVTSL